MSPVRAHRVTVESETPKSDATSERDRKSVPSGPRRSSDFVFSFFMRRSWLLGVVCRMMQMDQIDCLDPAPAAATGEMRPAAALMETGGWTATSGGGEDSTDAAGAAASPSGKAVVP